MHVCLCTYLWRQFCCYIFPSLNLTTLQFPINNVYVGRWMAIFFPNHLKMGDYRIESSLYTRKFIPKCNYWVLLNFSDIILLYRIYASYIVTLINHKNRLASKISKDSFVCTCWKVFCCVKLPFTIYCLVWYFSNSSDYKNWLFDGRTGKFKDSKVIRGPAWTCDS